MQQTLDKKIHLEANFINHVKIAKQSHFVIALSKGKDLQQLSWHWCMVMGKGNGITTLKTSGSSWNYAYNMYTSDPQAFLGISPTELYLYVY